jgi:hypothetical protein
MHLSHLFAAQTDLATYVYLHAQSRRVSLLFFAQGQIFGTMRWRQWTVLLAALLLSTLKACSS